MKNTRAINRLIQMEDLYIVGTGSQARYVIEICKKANISGLVDVENKDNVGKTINGIKVVCMISDLEKIVNPQKAKVIVAYGDNAKKKEIVRNLEALGYKFATAISDKAYISDFTEIGEGTIINPNAAIMPNAKIGKHVIIHSGVVIEHDNIIGDFANIAPGVKTAGNVSIGECTYLYTGAVVIPKVKIGKNAIVAAGAVVIKDVPDNAKIAGVPAKEIGRQ